VTDETVEEVEAEIDEGTESVDQETQQEAKPEEKAEEPKAPEGFISKENARKDINVQHKKYRDEERARTAAEEKAAALQKELDDLKASSVDLTIPPVPDPYAEDFAEKTKERDAAIARVAAHETQQQTVEQKQTEIQEQTEQAQAEAMDAKVKQFDANMLELGLNPLELKKAANSVVEYGVNDTLQDVLLEDGEGPLIVQYLAENPVELASLNQMTPLQMFNRVNELRPQAQLLKPQTSQAPPPGTELSGGGATEMEDPALQGVTFE